MPFQRRSHARLADQPLVQSLVQAMTEKHTGEGSVSGLLEEAAMAVNTDEGRPVLDSLRALAARHGTDMPGFLSELALGIDADLWDPRADRISLLTLHAAKGLEFPVVFVVGCEDGVLPLHWGSADEESLAEERRLLFVGMTRARQRLILTHARKRRWRGAVRPMDPSPFLDAIERRLLDYQQHLATKKPPPVDRQRTLFE
jgi:superfamily I DNA/RNA helicase